MKDRFKYKILNTALNKFIDKFSRDDFCLTPDGFIVSLVGMIDTNLKPIFCTGLKDKKGKLIYEGDIILHDNGKKYKVEFGYFNESVNFNEYNNTCYGWYINDDDDDDLEDFEQIHNENMIKVIGNIYENKELLEE